jgi:hypothetical protein
VRAQDAPTDGLRFGAAEHAQIGAWAQNSRIIRAEASDVHSPFKRAQVVWNVFSHEPMMARCPLARLPTPSCAHAYRTTLFTRCNPHFASRAPPWRA